MKQVIILTGVSGSGKTTVGQALAQALACLFYDGDAFHSPENVAKMAAGVPLTDADRAPWLNRLQRLIADLLQRGETAVVACSALKRNYRKQLRQNSDHVLLVYLQASPELIEHRLQERSGHYMKANMIASQFAALEEPDPQEAILVDAAQLVTAIVAQILDVRTGLVPTGT